VEGTEYGRKEEENERTSRIKEIRLVCDELTEETF
jgi:hypothetical protein